MRKASEIKSEMFQLRDHNHENSHKFTAAEQREVNTKMRALQKELSDLYSEGAKPCPKCGATPIAVDRATRFEVGCPRCRPSLIEVDGVKKRQSIAAQGRTPQDAVDNWNAGAFVIDDKLDMIQVVSI